MSSTGVSFIIVNKWIMCKHRSTRFYVGWHVRFGCYMYSFEILCMGLYDMNYMFLELGD